MKMTEQQIKLLDLGLRLIVERENFQVSTSHGIEVPAKWRNGVKANYDIGREIIIEAICREGAFAPSEAT